MRICLDLRPILAYPTGIGRMAHNLLLALQSIDSENHYLVLRRDEVYTPIPSKPNFEIMPCNIGQYSPKMHVEIPKILKRHKIDLYFSPYFVVPFWLPCPSVITIHDMIFSVFPRLLSPPEWLVYQLLMRKSLASSSAVTAVSNCTREDVLKYFPTTRADKVYVIHSGIGDQFQPVVNESMHNNFRLKYHLPEKYLCYVGNYKAHKNLGRLVSAFAQIKNSVSHQLVLLDNPGADCIKLKAQVQSSKLQDRIYFCGGLADSDLALFYSCADLFVFPSLYEGFGLPPLEAMACGTQVITSNTSSLPEVVGDAGIMIDPYNVEELAEAMLRVLRDPDLRQKMRAKGLERAKLFTWENTARQTLAVYNEAMAG